MNKPLNSRWRVVSTRASLEIAASRMYGGGAIATSFSRHPLPFGSVIIYRGTREIGSDSVPEDVFRLDGSEIAGGFSPSIWGGADQRAIMPVITAAIVRPRKQHPIDAGVILDGLSPDTIAAHDHAQMTDFVDRHCRNMLYAAGPTKLRPSSAIHFTMNAAEYETYRTWRAYVERIRLNTARSIATALEKAGGSATLRHGHFGTSIRSYGPSDIADAVFYGFATVAADVITLTERGCQHSSPTAAPA